MLRVLDVDRWPLRLLVPVAVLGVGANVPPLEPLSGSRVTVAALSAAGFGAALVTRYRRHRRGSTCS